MRRNTKKRNHKYGQTGPSSFQPIVLDRKRRPYFGCLVVLLGSLGLLLLVYLLYPAKYIILVMGIDKAPEDTAAGRSDTNILVEIATLRASVKGLSVPRDLWVPIPGYGENRINAAHYFGELEETANGPGLAMATFEQNFGVDVDYYLRIQLNNFPQVIDALGGIEVELNEEMAGLAPGTHLLNGEQALAFVRSRADSDDFARMQQGQVMVRALIKTFFKPQSWLRLPDVLTATGKVVDSDIPLWQYPRLGLALLFSRNQMLFMAIEREMVTPFTTSDGAQVLLPDWGQIMILTNQLFGK